jgi:hypothetical protein
MKFVGLSFTVVGALAACPSPPTFAPCKADAECAPQVCRNEKCVTDDTPPVVVPSATTVEITGGEAKGNDGALKLQLNGPLGSAGGTSTAPSGKYRLDWQSSQK